MSTILIVDDEMKIRDVVRSYLRQHGFQTIEADSGQEAIRLFHEQSPDLIILDLMLPDRNGEEVCQEIRRVNSVPILMLTAKISNHSRINGFSIGADDYLLKPFDPRELVVRVRAILRRSDHHQLLSDKVSYGDGQLEIDSLKHTVYLQGKPINLTPIEYKLLITLAKHPQRYFTREELIEKVLGFDYIGDIRTIDQHVKNVRQKIEKDSKNPMYIQTVYGSGYRFSGE